MIGINNRPYTHHFLSRSVEMQFFDLVMDKSHQPINLLIKYILQNLPGDRSQCRSDRTEISAYEVIRIWELTTLACGIYWPGGRSGTSRSRYGMFEPGAPKLHLNLSNLPIIICSATSDGGLVNSCAMFCRYRSSNCCIRISINADPMGFPKA